MDDDAIRLSSCSVCGEILRDETYRIIGPDGPVHVQCATMQCSLCHRFVKARKTKGE